jgi:NAD(P)-dependent dehydrogenase (short-subunit alcohol dehydrogenase family)
MKTVVVTGSTRGIGLGLAHNFLQRGCKVIVSSRNQQDVERVVQQLGLDFEAERVAGLACDICSYESLQGLWDFAVARFGRVDVWINNAGIIIDRAPLWEQSAEAIGNIVTTNLTGLLLANKVAMTGMKAQGQGQIWNMEGFGSNGMAQPGMAAYGATKRAVNYLNKALRKDTVGTGIHVCTLSPGMVVTDLLIGEYDTSSEEWQKVKRMFNILADKVETVTPWLVDGVLKANKDGAKVEWLTNRKAMGRFLTASFKKRDLFADMGI